jgi:hypothetical protein
LAWRQIFNRQSGSSKVIILQTLSLKQLRLPLSSVRRGMRLAIVPLRAGEGVKEPISLKDTRNFRALEAQEKDFI